MLFEATGLFASIGVLGVGRRSRVVKIAVLIGGKKRELPESQSAK